MVMVLGPTRKKADVMAEQRADRESRKTGDVDYDEPLATDEVVTQTVPETVTEA